MPCFGRVFFWEARDKKQEARDKKQETRNETKAVSSIKTYLESRDKKPTCPPRRVDWQAGETLFVVIRNPND